MARRSAHGDQYRVVISVRWLLDDHYVTDWQGNKFLTIPKGWSYTTILGPYPKPGTAKGAATNSFKRYKQENIDAETNGDPTPWDIDISVEKAETVWKRIDG